MRRRIALFFSLSLWNFLIYFNFFRFCRENLFLMSPFIRHDFSLICHQETGKLIVYGGAQSFLCARCCGIYAGSLLGSFLLIFVPGIRIRSKTVLISAIPMAADSMFARLGLYNYHKFGAFLTGFIFGIAGLFYICTVTHFFFAELKQKHYE